jgi:formylglycine-generating enzyme required for sulfatase activity
MIAAFIGLILLHPVAPARAQTPWPADITNPHPMDDDLVLPMPCGGQMVFRPVMVPSAGVLGDKRISLGGVAKEFGYKEYQRADYIAGGFTPTEKPSGATEKPSGATGKPSGATGKTSGATEKTSGRLYYLGKYDVTQAQFASLGSCPPLSNDSRLPQTSIGWIQAADFADAYTAWLIANAKDKLPSEAGVTGFLRLPTEEEWEYAARGGARVSDADFSAPLFPMSQPLVKYVWYNGTDSSNGRLQPVGLLAPNPLGLFDMLGDASQLTASLFRLNHVSRLQGQAGGYVTKGGSYLTPPDQIRSAARDEFVPYDTRGQRRLKSVGFRLALVAPAVPSLARLHDIESEWATLPESGGSGSLAEPVQSDPIKEAAAIAAAVNDKALKQRIEGLEQVIAANIKTRDDQMARAARSSLDLASWIGQKMEFDTIRLLAAQQVAAIGKTIGRTGDAARVPPRQQELTNTIDTYRDILRTLFSEYPKAVRQEQSDVLRTALAQRNLGDRAALLPQIEHDIATMQDAGDLPAADIQKRLISAYCKTDAGRTGFPDACKTNP